MIGMGGALPIDSDLHCIHCGYNLRGLTSASRCPECGRYATDSIRGSTLYRSRPAALRTIANGLFLLAIGGMLTAAALLVALGPWAMALSFGAGGGRHWLLLLAIAERSGAFVFLLAVCAAATHLLGTFLCTSTAGLAPVPPRSSDLRLAVRIMAGIGLGLFLIAVWPDKALRTVIGVLLFLLEIGQSYLVMSYVKDVAEMAGFHRRARVLRVLRSWPPFRILSLFLASNSRWDLGYLLLILPVFEVICGLVAAATFVLLGRAILRAGQEWPIEWLQARQLADSERETTAHELSILSGELFESEGEG
jgi:hypothetical protein